MQYFYLGAIVLLFVLAVWLAYDLFTRRPKNTQQEVNFDKEEQVEPAYN